MRNKANFLLIIAVVISIALGIFRINAAEPHADEWVVLSVFDSKWSDFLKDFFDSEGVWGRYYPPLYPVVARAYGSLFGETLVSMRILSVAALVGLVLLSWYSFPVVTQSQDLRWRIFFSLTVGTAPPHIWWAQTGKYTMFLYLMYALSIVAALRFIQNRSIKSAIISSFSLSAVIYTHYLGFIFTLAHFCTLVLVAVWRRDSIFIRRLILSAAIVALLAAPLLPVVYKANQLNERGGLFARYDQPVEPGVIIRGFLTHWNFGYSLIPKHGVLSVASNFTESISEWNVAKAVSALRRIALPLSAVLVLGISIVFSLVPILKSDFSQLNATYIIALPIFTFIFSLSKGLADRFMYFGFGTWCTLAFLVIGWVRCKRFKFPLALAISILVLFTISLSIYYQRLAYKYPGSRLVMEFLKSPGRGFNFVLVDEWITNIRGTPLEPNMLPPEVYLHILPLGKEIPIELLKGSKTVAFFGGTIKSVNSYLEKNKKKYPDLSWVQLESWVSMEQEERSIHAYHLFLYPKARGDNLSKSYAKIPIEKQPSHNTE
jgi:hypothetical protein